MFDHDTDLADSILRVVERLITIQFDCTHNVGEESNFNVYYGNLNEEKQRAFRNMSVFDGMDLERLVDGLRCLCDMQAAFNANIFLDGFWNPVMYLNHFRNKWNHCDENICIFIHGLDKETRMAWVKYILNTN